MTGKRTVVIFGAARMDANAGARSRSAGDKWWEFGFFFFLSFFLFLFVF